MIIALDKDIIRWIHRSYEEELGRRMLEELVKSNDLNSIDLTEFLIPGYVPSKFILNKEEVKKELNIKATSF